MDVNEKWLIENGFERVEENSRFNIASDDIAWKRSFTAEDVNCFPHRKLNYNCFCIHRNEDWIATFGEISMFKGGTYCHSARVAVLEAFNSFINTERAYIGAMERKVKQAEKIKDELFNS